MEDLSDSDISEIKSKLPTGMFELSKTDCNVKVKAVSEEFRKNQLKTQLFNLWKEKLVRKTLVNGRNFIRTPILSCVSVNEFEMAKEHSKHLTGICLLMLR